MKPMLIVLLSAGLLTGVSIAQTASPQDTGTAVSTPSPSQTGTSTSAQGSTAATMDSATGIAPGTTIPAELTKPLDAKKNKQGDRVEAHTTQDLLSRGVIVVPRGAKILGHVTQTQPRAKGESSSTVAIAFDQLVMKGGKAVPLNATIQAIAKPMQTTLLGGSGNEPMSESGGMPAGGGMHGSVGAGAGRSGGYPSGSAGSPGASQTDTASAPDQGGGALSPGAAGVVGMKDLSLSQNADASVISSDSQNVHLDSGTQLILRVK